jgi:outer membrane lipoprotein-sorting protein
MGRYLAILPAILFLSFIGCRTTSTMNIDNRSISSTEVQEIARTNHTRIQSIKGEGRISIETPQIAQSGAFILTLRKPDSVMINLQGPFGINVGSALVTRTGFSFYNSFENKLITGSTNTENLDRILHVRLSFDDLLNIFAGGEFLTDDLRSPDEIRIENNQFMFIYVSAGSSRRYWIDPTTKSIQRIQFLDQNGKLTVEQIFNDFENIDGIVMPYAIRIIRPKARQMLTLTYSDIVVNTDELQFTFTVPQNAERIRW